MSKLPGDPEKVGEIIAMHFLANIAEIAQMTQRSRPLPIPKGWPLIGSNFPPQIKPVSAIDPVRIVVALVSIL